jgi:hypothetical protein
MLGGRRVNRGVHAEETYRQIISISQVALNHVRQLFDNSMNDREGIETDRSRALEIAGRALERLAKVEGLFVPVRLEVSGPKGGPIPIEDKILTDPDRQRKVVDILARCAEILTLPITPIEVKNTNNSNGNGSNESHA